MKRKLAICQSCPDNFKARHCITADFEIDTKTDQDIPPCVYDQLERLTSIVDPDKSIEAGLRQIEANKIVMPHLVVGRVKHEGKIIEFLKKNEGEEFNAKTLHNLLDIPYDGLRKLLWRLEKSGKINKPQHGFYSSKCNLSQQQIEKIEHKIKLQIHNFDILISKKLLPDGFQLSPGLCLNPPTGGIIEAGNIRLIEASCLNETSIEARLRQVIDIAPNQSMTIQETPENYLIEMKAGKNPFHLREIPLISLLLKSIFGDAALKGKTVKLDLNDDLPMVFSPNQITYGDIHGMCVAVYGKGDITRRELRNFNPDISLCEFLEVLREFAGVLEVKPVSSEAVKVPIETKYVYGQSKPPLSEFRTGLEIYKERFGDGALEELRKVRT